MKRFTRFIAIAIMFTLCLSYMVVIPFGRKNVLAAESVGAVLTIKGLKSTAKIDQELEIPKGTSSLGQDSVNVVIKDPRGKVVTNYVRTTENSIVIKPTMLGYYTVQYSVNDGITKSQIYSIKVEGTKPAMEFVNNASVYLPNTIYDAKEVILPLPRVTVDSEEVENTALFIREGSHAESNTEGKNAVWVSAQDPNYNTVNLRRDEDGNVVFDATKDSNNNYVYGTYTLTYFYQSSNGLTMTKYASIEVEKNYKESYVDKIDMTFVWENGKTMPTSAVLGQKVQLPKAVAQNKANGNEEMQSHVTVTVDFIPDGNLSAEKIPYEVDQENLTFTPQNKTVNGGYYQIVYKVENYFGVKTITNTYKLTNVTDTVRPDVFVVADYSIEDAKNGNVDTKQDLSYMIPNKVIVSSENPIVLPAIYGTDNYAKFEDLELRRIWINGSNQTRLDKKDEDGNYITNTSLTLSYDDEELSETVRNCLKTPGTYSVRYEIYDGSNTNRSVEFEIVVLERSFVDSTAPRITMPTLNKVGFAGDTITFKAPTVVDYASDSLQEVNVDTRRCNVEVGYYAGSDYATFKTAFEKGEDISSYITSGEFNYISKLEDDNSYYSFTIPTNATYSELKIVVRATDNAKFGAPNDVVAKNNISVKDATMRVVKIDANDNAPAFNISQISSTLQEAGQNEKVYIQSTSLDKSFAFTGENQDFTEISVNVYDPQGNLVNVRGASTQVNASADQINLSGAYFTSSADGDYIITITAKDVSGNSTVVAYKLHVNDTIAPEIEGVPSTISVKVGEEYTLPVAVMRDNGEIKENLAENPIDFSGYDNPAYTFNHATNKFVALEAGTFTFEYRAFDGTHANENKCIVTIVASANTDPEQKLAFDDSAFKSTAALKPIIENDVETGRYETINIPYLTVENAINGIKDNSYSVKVVDPNGQEISVTVTPDDAVNYGKFEPTAKDGVYQITYTVEDNAGNKAEITKELRVGDLVKPEITIINQENNLPTSAKLGSTLYILSSDITYTDNSGEDGLTLTITMKDASGSTTTLTKTDGRYSYTFSNAGTYTLTYTVKDKAGNTRTETANIVVSAESNTETNTAVILTGVIIALVVVLAGAVVTYFVVVNKKSNGSKKDSKQTSSRKNLD